MTQLNIRLDSRQLKLVDQFGAARGHNNRSASIRGMIDSAAAASDGLDAYELAVVFMKGLTKDDMPINEAWTIAGRWLARSDGLTVALEWSPDGIGSDGELTLFGPRGRREIVVLGPAQAHPSDRGDAEDQAKR